MHFLLISENEFFNEIKRDGITSFMDFMNSRLRGRAWQAISSLDIAVLMREVVMQGKCWAHTIRFGKVGEQEYRLTTGN